MSMLDSHQMRVLLLAQYGFYASTIRRLVKRYDNTDYSVSSIYYCCKRGGVKLRDYRQGVGDVAQEVVRELVPSYRRRRTR